MKLIRIQMLGGFSLEAGNAQIADSGNRAHRVWSLLSYLIWYRNHTIPQQNLINLLWGEEADSANPENALRITMHRLRATLDQLWPSAGKDLILHRDGGYGWNPDAPIVIDCQRFDDLAAGEYDSDDARLSAYLDALSLYQGDFLPKQSSDFWVIPVATHFHNHFIRMTMEATHMLTEAGRYDEAVAICQKAVNAEPYHEELHQLLMHALGASGDPKGAAEVYENLRKRLFDDFGIQPSEETRQVFRMTAHSPEDRTIPIDEVLAYIKEPPASGAMVCDYDYFKILCFAESRSMERSGHATHVALFSVNSPLPGATPSKRTLEHFMELLEQQLQSGLRRGDTVARCSASQFLIMLPQANYEDSCMVCRRILATFHRNYPRLNMKVNYMVQPLAPSLRMP